METSFLELRCKEVINVTNGKCLGNIVDIVFDCKCGRVTGFIVPGCRKFFNIFKNQDDIFIPYNSICKIGEDTILVELFECDQRRNACICEADAPKAHKLGEEIQN
ncbi:MAG: YlmC/YmxH family sporulation protein [Clostridia bacterium]